MFIKVKAFPDYHEEALIKKSDDTFEIRVREKAKQGRANQKIRELLALHFKIPEGKVRLIKGARESRKIFEIRL